MAKRPYTGWDRNSSGRRSGTEALINQIKFWSEGGLWHNGSWLVRPMRGKKNPSVHGTGRAFDISWRGGKYGGYGDYQKAMVWYDFLCEHADALQIEAVFDYYPRPWGQGYKCDRDATKVYTRKAFSGAPGGDWFHIEVSNKYADDADFYNSKMPELIAGIKVGAPAKPAPVEEASDGVDNPTGDDYPGHVIVKGHGHKDEVKMVQSKVGAKVDGDFGPKTEEAVKAWQAANGLTADGVVGPKTWEAMFGGDSKPARAYPGSPIKVGSKGDDVKVVQAVIDAYVDGDFGPKTEASVKAWQSANGLSADGIVGPKTWKAMFD
jgi:peptidoglycan hydrolase-like protein with peptidoglycan-binding domain